MENSINIIRAAHLILSAIPKALTAISYKVNNIFLCISQKVGGFALGIAKNY